MRPLPWWKSVFPALLLTAALPGDRAFAEVKGTYFSLIDGDRFENSGSVRITVGANLKGTISVKLGDEKACVAGFEWRDGGLAIIQQEDPDMTIHLIPVQQPDGTLVISGTVTDDGTVLPVTAARLVTAAAAPGAYTFALALENGADAGFGTLQLDAKGRVRLAGTLSTGENFSAGGQLNEKGKYDVAGTLKGKTLSGSIGFSGTGNADISATLHCRKPARGVVAESSQTIMLTGAAYSPLYNAQSVKLTIEPVGLPPILHNASLTARGTYTITDQGADLVSLALARTNGLLTGRFKSAGKWKGLRGVVLQSTQGAKGLIQIGGGTFGLASTIADSTTNSSTDGAGVIKTGAGTLVLGGGNTYTGATVINVGGGALQFGGFNPNLPTLNAGYLAIAPGVIPIFDPATLNPVNEGTINLGAIGLGSGMLTSNAGYLGGTVNLGTAPNLTNVGSLSLAPGLSPGTFSQSLTGVVIRLSPGANLSDSQGNRLVIEGLHEGDIISFSGTT
ncbi:MAG: transporter, partial [Chthoniobacteraceae bacterium]|nr:transporter [Chthoniobacteraceae bacterium]